MSLVVPWLFSKSTTVRSLQEINITVSKSCLRFRIIFIQFESTDLEQVSCVDFAQVNVDHLPQHLYFIVAHFSILVLVRPLQVPTDPGEQR